MAKYSIEDIENMVTGDNEFPEITNELVIDLFASMSLLIRNDMKQNTHPDDSRMFAAFKKLPPELYDRTIELSNNWEEFCIAVEKASSRVYGV